MPSFTLGRFVVSEQKHRVISQSAYPLARLIGTGRLLDYGEEKFY